jgi:hypothetical protein
MPRLTATECAGVAGFVSPAWDAGRLHALKPKSKIAAMKQRKDIPERTHRLSEKIRCRHEEYKTAPQQRIDAIVTACDSLIFLLDVKVLKIVYIFLQKTNLVGFAAHFRRKT